MKKLKIYFSFFVKAKIFYTTMSRFPFERALAFENWLRNSENMKKPRISLKTFGIDEIEQSSISFSFIKEMIDFVINLFVLFIVLFIIM